MKVWLVYRYWYNGEEPKDLVRVCSTHARAAAYVKAKGSYNYDIQEIEVDTDIEL